MENRRYLLNNIAIIYFEYNDGSIVRCRATGNMDIAKENNILCCDEGLYDLDVKKKIPDTFLNLKATVYREDSDNDTRNDLDRFLNDYIKRSWV